MPAAKLDGAIDPKLTIAPLTCIRQLYTLVGVLVRDARTHVARDPLALVEDLNRAVREAHVNGLP
jgi:hypothetical protein